MNNFKVSKKGVELIKKFEGCYLKAYKCPNGVWAIGIGTTGVVDGKKIHDGMTITQEKAESLLQEDLKSLGNIINKLEYTLNQNQFDALVSFTYNRGLGNLYKLTHNNARTLEEISNAFLLYNKLAGKTLSELIRRRKAEKKLFDMKTSVKVEMLTN